MPASSLKRRSMAIFRACTWWISQSKSMRLEKTCGSLKAGRGSGCRPSARSSSSKSAGAKRRARLSRGKRKQSPNVRTPIPQKSCCSFGVRLSTSMGTWLRAAGRAARVSTGVECRARANQMAAIGVGALPKASALKPRWRSSRRNRANSPAKPPNSAKLPRTSITSASGATGTTIGVNW